MKNLIVANWKLNPTIQKEAKEIFDAIRDGAKGLKSEVVICPPFVYISTLYPKPYTLNPAIALGAQNVFWEEKGAFTGETSAFMLKDLGIEYVIIGHSERRKYFGETDEIINKKIKKSLEAGLKIIFCIGETVEENINARRDEVLQRQLREGLAGVDNLENINVAYEPVWAIGTGNNCSISEAKSAIDFIKKFVKPVTRILYGGSVKSENSGSYVKEAGANGLLVGGASLNAEEFVKIIESAN